MSNPVGLGIDPDLHHVGVGVVTSDRIGDVGIIRIPGNLRGEDAVVIMCGTVRPQIVQYFANALEAGCPITHVAVEGQTIYKRSKARPIDILRLAQVAGACLAAVLTLPVHYLEHIQDVQIPEPKRWKKQVKKAIHQARVLRCYPGWEWTSPKDKNEGLTVTRNTLGLELPKTHWKHILDGVGLARWAIHGSG